MSQYEDIGSKYPENFFYNLSKLSGACGKSIIKVSADRVDGINPSTISNIRLPIGMLLHMDSIALWFKVSVLGSNVSTFGRYSSTFIKRMSITMNNVTVQIIQDYNLLYSIYADHNNKGYSKGVAGEMLNPSVIWSEAAGASTQVAISGVDAMSASVTKQTDVQMCINNFLGFFGSASQRILPTEKVGECVISIQWADNHEVLGYTGEATAVTPAASDTYSISDLYLTAESLSFSDSTYYENIDNSDILIGFNDYVVTRFADVEKKSSVNCTTYMHAGSIDHLIGTCVLPQQSTPSPMVAYGSLGTGASGVVVNLFKYLSDPVAYAGNSSATATNNIYGDGFWSTLSMQRCLQHIESSSWSINNKKLNYDALNPYEIFQNNLNALGYMGVDSSADSLNPAIVSLLHYYKYFGCCVQSLELIDKSSFYISGLSSAGSSASVNWTCKFSGASNTMTVQPIIIAKISKVLEVRPGRSISVY